MSFLLGMAGLRDGVRLGWHRVSLLVFGKAAKYYSILKYRFQDRVIIQITWGVAAGNASGDSVLPTQGKQESRRIYPVLNTGSPAS